jgi:Amt family ammonium transporter
METHMKTRSGSGWKTRMHALALAALCGVAAFAASPVSAQDPAATPPVETAAAPAAEAPLVAPDAATAAATSAPAEAVATEAAAPVEPAAADAAPAEEAPTPTISKPDTVWVLVPGLALFYGGLVRSKNVLSILIQNLAVFSLVAVLWALYGYSFAFTEGNAFIGGTDRLFAAGLNASSIGATFTKGVYIPELAFFVFQGAFACITCALIVGAFAERVKFAGVMLFTVLWFTFAYLPMAHMVWFFPGPDAFTDTEAVDACWRKSGYLWAKGALDFAGGTVVHINAAVAGLVGAYVIGKRTGYGREAMASRTT